MAITIYADKQSGQWPLDVEWTFSISGGSTLAYLVRFEWDFGDGTTSYERTPRHVYRMPGVYVCSCRVWDDLGNTWVSTSITITVTDWMFGSGDGTNVSITDKCFRFAIPQKISQGIGWVEYDDIKEGVRTYGWPYPEAIVGCCTIMDAAQKQRHLVMDARTCRIYEIGKDEQWVDGDTDYGGTEMESEVTWREQVPPVGATAKLKHSQSHVIMKPWFKDRRNTGDYGSEGFRAGFEQDLYVKKDSSPTRFAITKVVPERGQIVFDRHIVSEFLQMGTLIRGAPWRLVRAQQWMVQDDTAGSPLQKAMSEYNWGQELAIPALWLARNQEFPTIDSATGAIMAGTYATVTTGPDSKSGSALVFSTGQGLLTAISFISGDFTIMGWFMNPVGDIVLASFTDEPLVITLRTHTGKSIKWEDDHNTIMLALGDTFGAWTQLVIARHGNDLKVWQNGSLLHVAGLTDSHIDYGGIVTLMQGICWCSDIRIVNVALSDDAVNWAYLDMTEYQGNVTCPPW